MFAQNNEINYMNIKKKVLKILAIVYRCLHPFKKVRFINGGSVVFPSLIITPTNVLSIDGGLINRGEINLIGSNNKVGVSGKLY